MFALKGGWFSECSAAEQPRYNGRVRKLNFSNCSYRYLKDCASRGLDWDLCEMKGLGNVPCSGSLAHSWRAWNLSGRLCIPSSHSRILLSGSQPRQ